MKRVITLLAFTISSMVALGKGHDLIASEILIERKVLPDFENQAKGIYK